MSPMVLFSQLRIGTMLKRVMSSDFRQLVRELRRRSGARPVQRHPREGHTGWLSSKLKLKLRGIAR